MDKQSAIELLGGTPSAAAEAIGISSAAVSQWPEVLPPRIADRVQAALWRRHQRALAQLGRADGDGMHDRSLSPAPTHGNGNQTAAEAF